MRLVPLLRPMQFARHGLPITRFANFRPLAGVGAGDQGGADASVRIGKHHFASRAWRVPRLCPSFFRGAVCGDHPRLAQRSSHGSRTSRCSRRPFRLRARHRGLCSAVRRRAVSARRSVACACYSNLRRARRQARAPPAEVVNPMEQRFHPMVPRDGNVSSNQKESTALR